MRIYTAISSHEKESEEAERPMKPEIADDVKEIVNKSAISGYTHHYRPMPGHRRYI